VGGSGDDQYIFENAIASQTDTIEELAAIGTDDLDFSFSTNPVVLDLLATTRQIGTHGLRRIQVNVIGQGANFENLYGGRGNDRLSGNNKANIIVGGVGSDILQGAGGNDMYLFDDPTGTENDQIGETAGGGIDLLDFSRSSVDIVANMSSNVAFVKQGNRTVRTVNNSAQQFEAFFGGFGDDTIRGNNANNFLDGRSGSDTLRGSRGDDVYNYSFLDGVEVIQELPNEGSDTITFATATQALRIDLSAPLVIGSMGFGGLNAPAGSGLHIENVIGTDNDDLIIGSDANNNIAGGAGRDFIISGRGRDQIFGGEGDDLLIAGTTLNLDSNAILAIFDEWLSSRGYGTRVSNIRGPNGGDNGSSFLTIRTVTDDNQTDVLAGEGGEDWFWVGVGDTSDRVVGESQN
jgi:Ca2+-binding RTX toxin-like protein